MPNHEIEEFARILVERVRDAAIRSSDASASHRATHVISRRWKETIQEGTSLESVVRVLAPDIVDDTIFFLLKAIDDGVLNLSFVASNGKVVNLAEEGAGELAGWYMGTGSWRAMYSKQRFVDDFSDLK